MKSKFCPNCGSNNVVNKIPKGDTHSRQVCMDCNHIEYENPKIIVGSVCTFHNKFLMCKRAIDPQKGLWTLPAGYLEMYKLNQQQFLDFHIQYDYSPYTVV